MDPPPAQVSAVRGSSSGAALTAGAWPRRGSQAAPALTGVAAPRHVASSAGWGATAARPRGPAGARRPPGTPEEGAHDAAALLRGRRSYCRLPHTSSASAAAAAAAAAPAEASAARERRRMTLPP
eukprot:scaffold149_cov383-Prasinococcus_capsulatus_cf.AAC.23